MLTPEIIQSRLHEIENEYNVRILLAVESGSRSWGFASPDSDWDARFIYVHPVEWYLTVEPGRDVIEIMDGDFDAAGWDLRKALQLFSRTNPSMLEWLHSPIRYIDDGFLANALIELVPDYFNITRAVYHYYSMAVNHNERYLLRDGVTLKRFLYYMRALLACKWIIERGTPPPVPFRQLIQASNLPPAILDATEKMLELKSRSNEHNKSTVDPDLFNYCQTIAADVQTFLDGDKPALPPRDKSAHLDHLLYTMALATKP